MAEQTVTLGLGLLLREVITHVSPQVVGGLYKEAFLLQQLHESVTSVLLQAPCSLLSHAYSVFAQILANDVTHIVYQPNVFLVNVCVKYQLHVVVRERGAAYNAHEVKVTKQRSRSRL